MADALCLRELLNQALVAVGEQNDEALRHLSLNELFLFAGGEPTNARTASQSQNSMRE
jgi:hypothetical protein